MSCGSGLMTRRLVRSAAYRRVLALDYSEAMLTETARRVREEEVPTEALTLCRADVAALPLQKGSVNALHAGAAMHCWPRLEDGLAQIRAALKPGGRFYATTFLQGAYGAGMPRQSGGGSFRFFESEEELKQLLVDAGFAAADVEVRREGRGCAVIKAVVADETVDEAVDEAEADASSTLDMGSTAEEAPTAETMADASAASEPSIEAENVIDNVIDMLE